MKQFLPSITRVQEGRLAAGAPGLAVLPLPGDHPRPPRPAAREQEPALQVQVRHLRVRVSWLRYVIRSFVTVTL